MSSCSEHSSGAPSKLHCSPVKILWVQTSGSLQEQRSRHDSGILSHVVFFSDLLKSAMLCSNFHCIGCRCVVSCCSRAVFFFKAWYVWSQVYLIELCRSRSARNCLADIFVSPSPNSRSNEIHFKTPPTLSTCSRMTRSSSWCACL